MVSVALEPFSTPSLMVWDTLRIYCSLASVIVMVGAMHQLAHPQPSLGVQLQRARALFIVGTLCVLLGEIGTNIVRLGTEPQTLMRLLFSTIGVSVLLVWLLVERNARQAANQ